MFKFIDLIKNMKGSDKMSFEDISTKWLAQKKIIIKQSTYAKYLQTINKHLLPILKEKTISDLEKRLIFVKTTMQRIKDDKTNKTKVIIDKPKTAKSIRAIPISNKLYEILLPLKRKYKYEYFFLTGNSEKYIEPRNYQFTFKKILKKYRIKPYKFHALRHTFSSDCIEVGMDIKSLSEILGHSSVKITLDKYVHSNFKTQKKYLEKL